MPDHRVVAANSERVDAALGEALRHPAPQAGAGDLGIVGVPDPGCC